MKSSQKNYLHRDLSDLRRTGKDHGSNLTMFLLPS